MVFNELQTKIHALLRREKYRLVQFIVLELAQQEGSSLAHEHVPHHSLRSSQSHETSKTHVIDAFLKKWKGSLKGVDPDHAKQQYLQEKYQ